MLFYNTVSLKKTDIFGFYNSLINCLSLLINKKKVIFASRNNHNIKFRFNKNTCNEHSVFV